MKGEAKRQTCDEKKTTSGTTQAATDYPGFRSATWNYGTRKRFRGSGGARAAEEGRGGGGALLTEASGLAGFSVRKAAYPIGCGGSAL